MPPDKHICRFTFLPSESLAKEILINRNMPKHEDGMTWSVELFPSWEVDGDPGRPNVASIQLFLSELLSRVIGTAQRRESYRVAASGLARGQLAVTERGIFCGYVLQRIVEWFRLAVHAQRVDELVSLFAFELEQWVQFGNTDYGWLSWNATRLGIDCVCYPPKPVL